MRTLRFYEYGRPLDVLRLEDAEPPRPGPSQIRIAVQTCGLNPADWALCGGLFAGNLPRGIGLEVSGTVDAVGDATTDVEIGDPVFGPAPFRGPTAGASEQALLDIWFRRRYNGTCERRRVHRRIRRGADRGSEGGASHRNRRRDVR